MATTNGATRKVSSGQSTGTGEVLIDTGFDVADGEDGIFHTHVKAVASGGYAYYIVSGRITGSTAGGTVDGQTTTVIHESSTGMDASLDVNSGQVDIAVTGVAATTIDWYVWCDGMIK